MTDRATAEPSQPSRPRILVAGVGNVLRRDDGFGVETAQRLQRAGDLPEGVTVIETGIGGMSLVQQLLDGYDALIVLDATQRAGPPGAVYVLGAETPNLADLDQDSRESLFADMHYAEPGRVLMLAKALGALPPRVWIVGCEPADTEDIGIGLTPEVARGVLCAVGEVRRLIASIAAEAAPVEPVERRG